MSRVQIEGFLFDDENEDKFTLHQISAFQVNEILEHCYVILRNRKKQRGLYLVIGRDNSGHCLSVPVEKTTYKHYWRPITAWVSKESEKVFLIRAEGR